MEWLKTLPIIGLLRETLDEYLSQYDDLCNRIDRYGDKLIELSHEENEVAAIAAPTPKVRILLFIVRFLLFNIIL